MIVVIPGSTQNFERKVTNDWRSPEKYKRHKFQYEKVGTDTNGHLSSVNVRVLCITLLYSNSSTLQFKLSLVLNSEKKNIKALKTVVYPCDKNKVNIP